MTSRCFLFETHDNTIARLFFVSRRVSFAHKTMDGISGTLHPNLFGLPEADRAATALVSQNFIYRLRDHGVAADTFFASLRRVVDKVILYDCADRFALTIGPEVFDHADAVLKFQGLYKDRDLYNYRVGALYAEYHWNDRGGGALPRQYTAAQLDKLRLSFPLFLANVPQVRNRRRAQHRSALAAAALGAAEHVIDRGFKIASALTRPREDIHHVGGLSHHARFDTALTLHAAKNRGLNRITSIPASIYGTGNTIDEFPWERPVDAATIEHYRTELSKRNLIGGSLPKQQFVMSMLRHKYIMAPTGFGELTHRHVEGWQAGRAVICQDISNVELLYPLEHEDNVIFCRPDLSDLFATISRAQSGGYDARAIGRRGRAVWDTWCSNWQTMFKTSFEDLIA